MNIIDVVIILFLLLGAVLGFKRGAIRTVVSFAGTIVVIILAYYLKNPLSTLLFTHLPFFKFGGIFEGVSILNILIYEAIAYIIAFTILMIILKIVIKVTKIFETVLKMTIILAIPSKIIGIFLGLLEAYIWIFVGLFIFTQFSFSAEVTKDSKYTPQILMKTPILSNLMGDAKKSFDEIYSLGEKYENSKDKQQYNLEALDILLKYEIIDSNTVENLIEKEKISSDGIDAILDKYERNK